ncbi:MAG: AmpG family muropeptide MFS transporter [Gammaproteobacteria bacterium]|nr:AmpG family muropeptide MFS transporter [Gammaproteobacteria bacterium]MBA3730854.1 AmpG family muropeptide MFS transporter [Gammaproteobacteria bacterium]
MRWLEALRVYRHPRVVAMLFLGFSAGLPFLLVFSTLSAWLSDANVSHGAIGFFSWVGITYSIKVLWAPVVDRVRIPWLTQKLGKRRSWMLVAQLGIALGLLGMAMIDPAQQLPYVAAFALLVAFGSATQDVAIDAYRIEAVITEHQAAMAAMYILGYRVALLIAGAGALYIAQYGSWPTAYVSMAALVSVGMLTVLAIAEPEHTVARDAYQREARVVAFMERSAHLPPRLRAAMAWFIGAMVCPFLDFFARNGVKMALLTLLFIGMFRISDITMGVMANPFYLDIGFNKAEIASVTKVFGFFMTIIGAAAGGLLVVRYGIMRPLLLGAVLAAATNLLFSLMAVMGPDLGLLAVTISADNLVGGLAGSVFIAYLSSLTNTAYTATQYALFSSLMTLPGKFIGGFSGLVVEAQGYSLFFIYSALIGVPAVLMVLYLMRTPNADQPQARNVPAQDAEA